MREEPDLGLGPASSQASSEPFRRPPFLPARKTLRLRLDDACEEGRDRRRDAP
jgi:hypothetical protein